MMKRNQLIVLLTICVVAICFYLQYRCYVPSSDDMYYKFICNDVNHGFAAPDVGEGTQYIESFSDVLRSMNYFYTHINGRYLVHVAVQTFTAMVPIQVFAAINALFYALFLFLLCRFCISNPTRDLMAKVLICIAGAWFLIPFQGMTFLGGIATAVNYLWTTVFMLAFLVFHQHLQSVRNEQSWWKIAIIFLFGAFVGSLHEGFSVGLCGVFFFYLVVKWKQATKAEKSLLIGLFIGAAFCILSPGNFIRLSSEEMADRCSSFLFGSLSSWAIDALLFSVILLWLFNREYVKSVLRKNIFLIGIILFNSLFCIFIAYIGRHQLTCNSVCSLIITIRLWAGFKCWKPIYLRSLAAMLLLAMVLSHAYVYRLREARYTAFSELCANAINKQPGDYVACRSYEDINYLISNSPLTCHYYVGFMPFVCKDGLARALSLSLSHGKDIHLLDNLYPDEPSAIATICTPDHCVAENIYTVSNNYYVVVLPDSIPLSNITAKIKVRRRAFFLSDTEESIHPKEHFELNGKYYYILGNRGSLEPIIGVTNLQIGL